jgi:ribosome-associated translation inhibitor RaiA
MHHGEQKDTRATLPLSRRRPGGRARPAGSSEHEDHRRPHEGRPGRKRPAVARAVLDLNGRLLQAATAAPSMHEAIKQLHDGLRHQVEHLTDRRWPSAGVDDRNESAYEGVSTS